MNFKQQFLFGMCDMEKILDCTEEWHTGAGEGMELSDYLGLSEDEMQTYVTLSDDGLQALLEKQRKTQRFRIFQLDLEKDTPVRKLAFRSMKEFAKEGYSFPPGEAYQLVYQSEYLCPAVTSDFQILEGIFTRFNVDHPKDYTGRSLSVSDVVELCEEDGSRFYFCDHSIFRKITFDSSKATV